jgi:guanylate kinase
VAGSLFILCAPSGAGKTSLVKALLEADPAIKVSVSYTTRPPRAGEADGVDYHFVTRTRFDELQAQNEFLESAFVHGNYYATSHTWIGRQVATGQDVLLEIDWQGAAQVRKLLPDAVTIFILPPSLESLEERLNRRGLDAPEVIAQRLAAAREEICHVNEFDYVIINEDFSRAAKDLCAIVRASRLRRVQQLSGREPWLASLMNLE